MVVECRLDTIVQKFIPNFDSLTHDFCYFTTFVEELGILNSILCADKQTYSRDLRNRDREAAKETTRKRREAKS